MLKEMMTVYCGCFYKKDYKMMSVSFGQIWLFTTNIELQSILLLVGVIIRFGNNEMY